MQLRRPTLPDCWRWFVLSLVICCLSCSGGPKLNPVKGKIIYKGQPLADASVIFHPEGGNFTVAPSTGVTDEAGSYTLWTGDKEGAPAGQYKVTISCSEEIGSKTKTKTVSLGQKPEYKDRLKGAYADLKNSQIKFEITSGTNELQTINLQ